MTDILGRMDAAVALQLFIVSASLLGVILASILAYWVIRLAVGGALRSHHYWLQKRS